MSTLPPDSFVEPDDPFNDYGSSFEKAGFPSGEQTSSRENRDKATRQLFARLADGYHGFDRGGRIVASDGSHTDNDGSVRHRLMLTGYYRVPVQCTVNAKDSIFSADFTVNVKGSAGSDKAYPMTIETQRRFLRCHCAGNVVGDSGSYVLFDLCGKIV